MDTVPHTTDPLGATISVEGTRIVLRLYVTGGTLRSSSAIRNVRALCDRYLAGRCDLSIIDIYQQPGQAVAAQLFAAPTLVKELPLPRRLFVGTLSDASRFLLELGLPPEPRSP
jgi:circadian clock protein KaiB